MKCIKVKLKANEWALIITGMIVILSTWLYDYGKIIFNGGYAKDFFTLISNSQFIEIVSNYNPSYFNWPLFLLGLAISSFGILIFYLRIKSKR